MLVKQFLAVHLFVVSCITLTSSARLAVVTGSSKGIGYETVKQLCSSNCKTVMACRSRTLGQTAADELRTKGFDVEFRELDISSEESICNFAEGISKDYGFGSVDILGMFVENFIHKKANKVFYMLYMGI